MRRSVFSMIGLGLLCLAVGLGTWRSFAQSPDDQHEFEFVGKVTTLPNTPGFVGDWVVGGRTVHVSASTKIDQDDGMVAVGSLVEIHGSVRSDNSVDATKIEVKEVEPPEDECPEFRGTIQNLPSTPGFIGDWTVSGTIIHVTAMTTINTDGGPVAVGNPVEIHGCRRTDGSIDAQRIEVLRVNPLPDCIEFDGVIQTLPMGGLVGDWTVGGRTIHVTASTAIKVEQGPVAVGAFVEIKGCLRTDGSMDASRIEVEQQQEMQPPFFLFFGVVQTLPPSPFTGDWVVSGRTVHVTATTRIEHPFRPLAVGSLVKVIGSIRADGSIDAVTVDVERADGHDHKINFFEFFGTVQVMPASGLIGDWTISGQIVHVSAATQFNDEHGSHIVMGSRVVVVGTQRTDLTLDAARIHQLHPIDDAADFVAQNFNDFLNRDPDSGGLAFWTSQITSCGNNAACVESQRVSVSAAFFQSQEFQLTGSFVERMYLASFGRLPQFLEFLPDTQMVSQNISAGASVIEANKQAFTADWVRHPDFTAIFDNQTDAEFVDLLFANAGVTPNAADRNMLVAGLSNGSMTRTTVLRQVVDNQLFVQQEFNRAFVLMQYFGYLRRDPDSSGFDFWVNVMNRLNGDFKKAAMVQAFIDSSEYHQRFPSQ